MSLWRIALRNTRRLSTRLIASGIAVAIGAGLFLVTQGLVQGVETQSQQHLVNGVEMLRIDVAPIIGPDSRALSWSDVSQISSLPDVRAVTPNLQTTVWVDQPKTVLTVVEPVLDSPLKLASGSSASLVPLHAGEAIVSRQFADAMGAIAGSDVSVKYRAMNDVGGAKSATLRVVGINEDSPRSETGQDTMYVSFGDLESWVAAGYGETPDDLRTHGYDQVAVFATQSTAVPAITAAIQKMGFRATDLQARLAELPRLALLAQIVGYATLLIVGLLIVLNTSSIVAAFIRQRRREIGLLKAIGFRDRDILLILLMEQVVSGLILSVVGVVVGLGLCVAATQWLAANPQVSDSIGASTVFPSLEAVGVAAGMVLAATAAGALLPAINASRLDAAVALRDL